MGALDWTYDAVGNRATQVMGGLTDIYAYPGSSNRLTSVSNAKHALGYDASGNVVSDTQGANAWTYVYNSANRMESVSKDAAVQGTYVYNAMGQKVRRVAAGVTTNVVHDVQGRRIAEYNASGNLLIREYVWLGDKPVAVVEGSTVFYIRADNINRPIFATNAAGTKVWTASYLPFGGVTTSTGTPITLRFPSQWFELESGLHQNWMRDYDPTTGRYLQSDPLGLVDGAGVDFAGPGNRSDISGMFGVGLLTIGTIVASAGNDNVIPFPSGPKVDDDDQCDDDDECEGWRKDLMIFYTYIKSGQADDLDRQAYLPAARAYNAACVPEGFAPVPVNF